MVGVIMYFEGKHKLLKNHRKCVFLLSVFNYVLHPLQQENFIDIDLVCVAKLKECDHTNK